MINWVSSQEQDVFFQKKKKKKENHYDPFQADSSKSVQMRHLFFFPQKKSKGLQ